MLKCGIEGSCVENFVKFSRKKCFRLHFFINLVSGKHFLLRAVFSINFRCKSPHFSNTFPVICNITKPMTNKESLTIECDKNLLEFTNQLNALRNYQKNYKREKFSKTEVEYIDKHLHLHILLTISYLDNVAILKHLNESEIEWEILYFLKKIYLNIYETIKSYNNNSKFIKEYFKNNESVVNNFEQITSTIRKFKKEHKLESHIKDVRNIIAGHIDKNFNEYFDIVNTISTEKTVKTGIEFMSILNELMSFLVKITPKLREN